MKLTYQGLQDRQAWAKAGIRLPQQDIPAMLRETEEHPVWLHFGAGNIFRIFIASLQQKLLDEGLAKAGIVAAETFDMEIIDRIYRPYDSLTLGVTLHGDGSTDKAVIASIAKGVKADSGDAEAWETLKKIFRNPSLQMVSYTITEKGYALYGMDGNLLPLAAEDAKRGPSGPRHAMAVTASLLLERFNAGGTPIAVVSMDNCSHNGEKLKAGVVGMAEKWLEKGLVPASFLDWLKDEEKVSFPWSMIDKITPRPHPDIAAQVAALGVEDTDPIVTGRGTYIAPFVNAEEAQYLVVEDRFPNGRPALEKAGVYMTDRNTVNDTERMKVTTCLNPLHTALAVYGCMLGYTRICDEMHDEDLVNLIRNIGYVEGLPVVTDPGIISPRAFIDEVVNRRLPNPFMPDTPQRIATDTSQKVPVRFGETLKSYAALNMHPEKLQAIPMALAGWLRYLIGLDDKGEKMEVSSDPMLKTLQETLKDVRLGDRHSGDKALDELLSNTNLFAVDLKAIGLADRVAEDFRSMLEGPGSVRKLLKTLKRAED